jgi:GDP-L-fucose synthase
MNEKSRIYVAGHTGMVGSAIVRKLEAERYHNILKKSRKELNLLDQRAVHDFFRREKPEYVFLAAAKVGGIVANDTYPADFIYENLAISSNVIHAAAENGVIKLVNLGSSCVYPKLAPQPIREESLLSGPLEPSNEGYAVAKIAAIKLCEMYFRQYRKRFVSAMPSNLYGPHDRFHLEHSHVIPGLLRRFHEAKVSRSPEVKIWGTGKVRREFTHVDDLADALYLIMQKYEDPRLINAGYGSDLTVLELAEKIKNVVGFEGGIVTDPSRPDGTPQKLIDSSRVRALGWRPKHDLDEGLAQTYRWAVENAF